MELGEFDFFPVFKANQTIQVFPKFARGVNSNLGSRGELGRGIFPTGSYLGEGFGEFSP